MAGGPPSDALDISHWRCCVVEVLHVLRRLLDGGYHCVVIKSMTIAPLPFHVYRDVRLPPSSANTVKLPAGQARCGFASKPHEAVVPSTAPVHVAQLPA